MNKVALAVIAVSIIIGIAVAGFLATDGLGTPTRTVTCGPSSSQGCSTCDSSQGCPTSTSNNSTGPLSGCAQAAFTPVNGYGSNITLAAGQTLNFCLQLYYYSTPGSAPATVNLTSLASLESLFDSSLHSALTNFTMTHTTWTTGPEALNSIQLGGPSNDNEGFVVVYQITPKPGITSGAYGLNLAADEPNPNGGVEGCTTDFLIVLGNGVPNYDNVGSCVGITASQSAGTPYIPNQLVATGFGVSYTNG